MKKPKIIHLSENTLDEIIKIAVVEKRRGKVDSKNFIEDLVEQYVEAHKSSSFLK